MLGPVWFDLGQVRPVQPFFVAPWADEPGTESLPGVLRRLRGEWPCVPFGVERVSPPTGWAGRTTGVGDGALHGFGANNHWSLIDRGIDWIELGITYPTTHSVRGLRRRIAAKKGVPALEITLEIEAAEQIDLGLALHPTFRLPAATGAATIEVAGFRRGLTFPEPLDASGSAAPGQWFDRLDRVPGRMGHNVDFTRLPAAMPNEDLLQLEADGGSVRLSNHEEGWRAHVNYDAGLFPTTVLWITNQGWSGSPWSSRTRALGIEPARAAFDLGQAASGDPGNPLARAGVPTSIRLAAGETLETRYSIEVEALE
jgi:hypothetical protein